MTGCVQEKVDFGIETMNNKEGRDLYINVSY